MDVTNSFGVPFEEDKKDPNIWFLDHNYLENMYGMFRRVNAKERVLGFYSTGPGIRPADLNIDALFRRLEFGPKHPVLVVVDIKPDAQARRKFRGTPDYNEEASRNRGVVV